MAVAIPGRFCSLVPLIWTINRKRLWLVSTPSQEITMSLLSFESQKATVSKWLKRITGSFPFFPSYELSGLLMKISFQNWKNLSAIFLGKKERCKYSSLRVKNVYQKNGRIQDCLCCLHVDNHYSWMASDQTTSQKSGGPAYRKTFSLLILSNMDRQRTE